MLSKKVLGTVLTAAMVVATFAPVVKADTGFTDVKDADTFASAVKDLNALGVMQGDATGGTFRPADKFTRAEAAKVLVVATGYGKLTGTSKNGFSDVAATDWFNGVVNVANQVGLVQGYTKDNKKVFNPSGNVTYGEFATMAVRALGYQDDDLSGSTWPYNYIAKATELGLFDDLDSVDATAPATRADIAVITDKLLSTPTVAEASKPDSYDADGKLVSKGTLLTSVIGKLGLATVSGTVYATNNEDSSLAAGKVQIWNDATKALETYDIASSTIKEDLGKHVAVYVSKKGAVASIQSADGTTVTGTVSSGKLNGDAVPTSGAVVYFNGVKKASTFVIPDGSTVTYRYTTNTDGTKKYDSSVIYATNANLGTYVVAGVDTAKNTISVYGDLKGSTSTKTINVISGATVAGDATKLADIKQYDVIQVNADVTDPTSTDTMTKEAIKVVRKSVAGKLASKSADGATVTIGSTSYSANDASLIPSDAFDTAYTYVLGADGKIARSYNPSGVSVSTFDASKYGVFKGVYNAQAGLTTTTNYVFLNGLGKEVNYAGPSATPGSAVYPVVEMSDVTANNIRRTVATYPTDVSYQAGAMDIKSLNVATDSTNVNIVLGMNKVMCGWGAKNGFDHAFFTMFLGDQSTGATVMPYQQSNVPAGYKWQYELTLAPTWADGDSGAKLYSSANAAASTLGTSVANTGITVKADTTNNTITVNVPKALLTGVDLTKLNAYVSSWDSDGGDIAKLRGVDQTAGQWSFGGGLTTDPKIVSDVWGTVGSTVTTVSTASNLKVGDFGQIKLDSNNKLIGVTPIAKTPDYISSANFASLLADDSNVYSYKDAAYTVYNGKVFKSSFTVVDKQKPDYVIFGAPDAKTGFAPIELALFTDSANQLKGAQSSTYVLIPDITTAVQIGSDAWTVNDSNGKTVKLNNTVYNALKNDNFSNNYRVISSISYDTTDTAKVVGLSDISTQLTEKQIVAADASKFAFDLTAAPTLYADNATVFVVGADLKPVAKTTADITPHMDVKYHLTDGKVDFAVASKIVSNVKFVVNAPASTNGEDLYLVGDFCNWNAGDFWTSDFNKYASAYKMTNPTKNADGTYTYTLAGVNNLIVGSKYQVVRNNTLTTDKWHSLAGNADKSEIKNNYVVVDGNDSSTVNLTVAAWRDR